MRDSVGGVSTQRALDLLLKDDETEMICVISKPPGERMVEQLAERLSVSAKPIVGCFLGVPADEMVAQGSLVLTRTLEDAVDASLDAIGVERVGHQQSEQELLSALRALAPADEQRFARGVFAGGTFCYQAQQILADDGIQVASNAPIPGMMKLPAAEKSVGHTMVDMGEEEFTSGRPHPMIDPGLRLERIRAEGHDPSTAILLLDFILGWNASPDPCGDLVPAIRDLQNSAKARSHVIPIVASITGTDGDPQSREKQAEILRAEGILVAPSSTAAARLTVEYVRRLA